MNEIGKVSCAGALVALGLGSAFLCGPPADVPLVVHEQAASSDRLHLGPLRGSADVSRSNGDARLARQLDAGGDSPSGMVILSAASGIGREEPLWQPGSSAGANLAPLPPQMIAIDDEATPLVANNSPPAGSSDEWMLQPPKIPQSYSGQSTTGDSKPILASESTPGPGDNNNTSAWWTQDTPRLQGLSANRSSASRSEPQRTTPTAPPAVKPQNTLAGPIDLDPPKSTAESSRPVLPVEPPSLEPMRMHRIADGDTLARLATRYLKDPDRAGEIFEMNRDVLSHPDLLPIGAALRIPGGSSAASELEDSASVGRLVPVGPTPMTESRPQAQLQGPTPIASSGW